MVGKLHFNVDSSCPHECLDHLDWEEGMYELNEGVLIGDFAVFIGGFACSYIILRFEM